MKPATITDAHRAELRDLQARIDAVGRRIRWAATEAEAARLEADRLALLRDQAASCRRLGFTVVDHAA